MQQMGVIWYHSCNFVWTELRSSFGLASSLWCDAYVKEKSKKEVFNSCNAWNLETSEKVNMETELGKLPDHRKWGKSIWVSNMWDKLSKNQIKNISQYEFWSTHRKRNRSIDALWPATLKLHNFQKVTFSFCCLLRTPHKESGSWLSFWNKNEIFTGRGYFYDMQITHWLYFGRLIIF